MNKWLLECFVYAIVLLHLILVGSRLIPIFEKQTKFYFPDVAKHNAVWIFTTTTIYLLIGYPTGKASGIGAGPIGTVAGMIAIAPRSSVV